MHWTLMLWLSLGANAFANPPAVPEEALQTLAPEATAELEEMAGEVQATEQALADLQAKAQAEPPPTPVQVAEQAVETQLDAIAAAKDAGDKKGAKAAKAALKTARAELDAAIAAGDPAPAPAVDPAEIEKLEGRHALLVAELELARARAVVAAGAEMNLTPYEDAVRAANGEVKPVESAEPAAPEESAKVE